MVNDLPKKEYISEAMEKTSTRRAYFVINNYWWRFREISEEAKKTADEYKIVDNGKSIIFKYTLK